MAGILKLLAISEKNVDIGKVTGKTADGRYILDVRGKTMKAQSYGIALEAGQRAVIASTSDGAYIVSKQLELAKQQKEVVVSG